MKLTRITGILSGFFASYLFIMVAAEEARFELPPETDLDLNSGYALKYENLLKALRNGTNSLFRCTIDLDGDRNGVIDERDPSWMEYTPPGQVMTLGSVEPMAISITSGFPFSPVGAEFTLEVTGINRAVKSGRFNSIQEELNSAGRVIVWSDQSKKTKLLDSADPQRRVHRWKIMPGYVVPGKSGVPSRVYIEATGLSGKYAGDVRLLAAVSPLPVEKNEKPEYTFLPRFDHVLITVVAK